MGKVVNATSFKAWCTEEAEKEEDDDEEDTTGSSFLAAGTPVPQRSSDVAVTGCAVCGPTSRHASSTCATNAVENMAPAEWKRRLVALNACLRCADVVWTRGHTCKPTCGYCGAVGHVTSRHSKAEEDAAFAAANRAAAREDRKRKTTSGSNFPANKRQKTAPVGQRSFTQADVDKATQEGIRMTLAAQGSAAPAPPSVPNRTHQSARGRSPAHGRGGSRRGGRGGKNPASATNAKPAPKGK